MELYRQRGSEADLVAESSAMSRLSSGNTAASRRQIFLDIVRQSNASCESGDYQTAVALYSEALKIDPDNHILYSNRSAAYIKLGQFARALQDALKARDLNPKWSKAYYRQGVALQCLGKHADALAAFSAGLAEDPKSGQLLSGLMEAATKSPLKGKLEPTFEQLRAMKLSKSSFVVISVIGQELLAAGNYSPAVLVLESALKIGTANLKLKGSVYSALSSAYWALNSLEKAISYMQQDLAVSKSLGDVTGECRAHGNLGSAYFSKANYKDALTSHRYQLVLAMKCKDTHAAASALTSLGHVYTAVGDYANALASHKQCVQLLKQMGDLLQEAREIGNVGAVYLVMGDFDNAIDCHMEHLRMAKQLQNKVEEARAYSNLGSSYHYRRNFEQAITFHNHVLKIAQDLRDKNIEVRAYAGLGHAARCMGDYMMAKMWHEKQLDMALSTKDKVAEARACSNLGIVFQLLGDHDAALKLHQAHLNLAISLRDRAGMGRAYGNIGNAYNAMGLYEQAIKYHKQELAISKEVNDRSSEASTHGNLAVAYQALGMYEKALVHYHSHLNISRELKDTSGEACALLNLGNCHSSHGDFSQAIPFYENYLMLSQELSDVEGEGKACHFLGYAHYSLGNFKEAVRYYDQDLAIAKELQNKTDIAKAYCNLGLTHLALGSVDTALECQKFFLTMAHSTKDVQSKYRALGNIGTVFLRMRKPDEAIKIYQKQVLLAKANGDKVQEAAAYGSLGAAYRVTKRYDRALGFHTQELTILQEINDLRGECRAHGNLGAVHMSLGNYTSAIKCYEEMLERAKDLKDAMTEAQAYGNLGIARMNICSYEEGVTFFELQISVLEALMSSNSKIAMLVLVEKGRAYGNLGDCFSALNDFEEAIRCHDRSLQISLKTPSLRDQERTYRALGLAHKAVGNAATALMYFEKRLSVINLTANDCGSEDSSHLRASAYGDIGQEQLELGHFDQAISCFQQQLNIVKETDDRHQEAQALSFLGKTFHLMGNHSEALQYHEADLSISQELDSTEGKARAYNHLGMTYESLGNFDQALLYQEYHLNAANQIDGEVTKAVAFSHIGRIHHALGNNIQAVAYLQQGLQIFEKTDAKEEEAKVRHFLGLALWRHGDLESALAHLEKSTDLLENIRLSTHGTSSEYYLHLFDRQIASFHALQRILVSLGRTDLALLFAEKCRTIANTTLPNSHKEYAGGLKLFNDPLSSSNTPINLINSVDLLVQRVNRHRAAVLYFSAIGGYLYSWLLIPERGIVKFNESCINTDDEGNDGDVVTSMGALLKRYIDGTRDALGIDFNTSGSSKNLSLTDGQCESDGTDLWSQHLEELGDKLNQDNDKTGFLRMVSRNHRFNCSSYSLSSLFSVGSATGSVKSTPASRPGSTRSRRSSWQGPSCLRSLYQMLIAPFEEELSVLDKTCFKELILVLETDLLLVPFPLLRSCTNEEYLCEKFKLIITPAISSLRNAHRSKPKSSGVPLIIGSPALPSDIMDQWGWEEIPRAESEAKMVGEILQCDPILGTYATKENILQQISNAECIHFATHISWKLSAIVLSPGNMEKESSTSKSSGSTSDGSCGESSGQGDSPAFSEYLLTAADILKLRLNAKLVVLSSCHTRDRHGLANSESIIALCKALLAAGAMAVILTLWPVPETASKIFFRTLYSSLLQGSRASHAVTEAMLTVQHTKQFAHPANWSGYLLVGSDVQLSNKVALTSQAIWELLKAPERSRDALRVTLHLVEKSLQRINTGQKNAMYTTQQSIENKVGSVSGWKEILMSVGFRFEPASNGLPAAVFFPQCDPGERLVKCSASLQALLGLSGPSVNALSKLLSTPEAGDDVISILRQAIAEMATKDLEKEKVEVRINVKLWGMAGCHELLAALGFDLIEVGENEVILSVGKHVSLRMLQLALQATLALFDTQTDGNDDRGSFDRSLSLESLELGTEELCEVVPTAAPSMQSVYLPVRQQIAMGKGAFTSYVRSRGEPDGHTNTTIDTKGRDHLEVNFINPASHKFPDGVPSSPSSRPPIPPIRGSGGGPRSYPSIAVKRADSSSSGSSMTDWENGLSTVRRKAPSLPVNNRVDPLLAIGLSSSLSVSSFSGFDSAGSDSDLIIPAMSRGGGIFDTMSSGKASSGSAAGKRVTWKMNEACGDTTMKVHGSGIDNKPWVKLRTVFNGKGQVNEKEDVPSESKVQDHAGKTPRKPPVTRDLPITDVYNERNMGLGLAPPLSKLLLTNRLNLGQIESGNKSDTEGMSMDDTLSTFDQLSLADDTIPDCNYSVSLGKAASKKLGHPISLKSAQKNKGLGSIPKCGSGTFVTTAEVTPISLNLVGLTTHGDAESTSSSSKSSPSDLSRRDDGDGRSLTDSQYGSYSPSMAQNHLIQSAAAVYFASRRGNAGDSNTTTNVPSGDHASNARNPNEIIISKSSLENNNVFTSSKENLVEEGDEIHNGTQSVSRRK
ncbi:unnamed protein product [Orchesella dallaii]|uniref:Tetratricopeptide repeat protein 28 n=1 Tax=Orchesella dallaii TaxID=48710 RepID=A0ABP1Q0M8_9HEXA